MKGASGFLRSSGNCFLKINPWVFCFSRKNSFSARHFGYTMKRMVMERNKSYRLASWSKGQFQFILKTASFWKLFSFSFTKKLTPVPLLKFTEIKNLNFTKLKPERKLKKKGFTLPQKNRSHFSNRGGKPTCLVFIKNKIPLITQRKKASSVPNTVKSESVSVTKARLYDGHSNGRVLALGWRGPPKHRSPTMSSRQYGKLPPVLNFKLKNLRKLTWISESRKKKKNGAKTNSNLFLKKFPFRKKILGL